METYLLSWDSLLGQGSVEAIFCRWNTNATWDVQRILSAMECLRMGSATRQELFEEVYVANVVPPAATLPAGLIRFHWPMLYRYV